MGGITQRLADRARLGTPGRPGPRLVATIRWFLGPLVRLLFRPRLEGSEHLPADRPFLLVANHSGGGAAEVGCLATLWLERLHPERPLTAMAHPLAFYVPGIAAFLRGAGAIPSSYRHAEEALARGVPVLVFPGGDHEAFRPLWQAGRVDFAGRRGFLALARRARVPVVPLGIRGSHYTVPILLRSRLLAWLAGVRAAGLKRLPVTLWLVAGVSATAVAAAPALGPAWTVVLCWLWVVCPLTYFLPLVPWPIRLRVGPPLEPGDLFGPPGAEQDLGPAYAQVVAAVQRLVREG